MTKTNKNHYDYLIVGGGLYGCMSANRIKASGKTCLIIEKEEQLGGNLRCENIEGINVHIYGAHIFHTSNQDVWRFVNSIVEFNRYTNCPVANYRGRLYNLPFNMNTFYQMWGVTTPEEVTQIIDEQRTAFRKKLEADGRTEPANLEEQAILLVGCDIYEKLIKGYTEKQWGRPCCELPSFIIRRLPVRLVFDNNYFNDKYQGVPIGGYNRLIEGLVDGIEVKTNCDYFENREYWNSIAVGIVYTGPIDRFFDYKYGKLQYRSVRFETEILDTPNFQGNAVINYTASDVPFTRIIEHKHFEMFGEEVYNINKTIISREYSVEWQPGIDPYYPINNKQNSDIYARYSELAKETPNVIFGGRLAEYRYYDMAPIVEKVLDMKF